MDKELDRMPWPFLTKAAEAIITKNIPIYANLLITRRCNLRCAKCRVTTRASSELDLSDWKNVIDNIHRLGTRVVGITGGEPLLRKDILLDIVEYLCAKGFIFNLASNGVDLDKDYLEELVGTGLKSIGLTLDSLDVWKETRMGRGNATNKVKDILEWYKYDKKLRSNLSLTVSSVVTRENLEEIPNMIKFISSYGARFSLGVLQSDRSNRWWLRSYAPELEFKKSDERKLTKVFNELIQMRCDGYPIIEPIEYLDHGLDYILSGRGLRCYAGELFFCVNSDGKVMPCQDLPPIDWVDLTKIEDVKRSWLDISKTIKVERSKCPGCFWECYYMPAYMVNYPLKYLASRLCLSDYEPLSKFGRLFGVMLSKNSSQCIKPLEHRSLA